MSEKVTPEDLNSLMEFEVVIEVHPDGSVSTRHDLNPYFDLNVATDGTDEFDIQEGWELLTGFTGQYSYNGPVMHPSEYIGGGMARHILETPGLYIVLEVSAYGEHEWQYARMTGNKSCAVCGLMPLDEDDEDSPCRQDEPAGWAVAFKASE
jgi:hypothetical protein